MEEAPPVIDAEFEVISGPLPVVVPEPEPVPFDWSPWFGVLLILSIVLRMAHR